MNANFFCLDAWICKKELYICYVNNDKQTHNDMNNIIVTPETLATESNEQRAARHAEFYARCNPNYAAYNRGQRTAETIAAKKAVVAATQSLKA